VQEGQEQVQMVLLVEQALLGRMLLANGGTGGSGNGGSSVAGGTATDGDINIQGGYGVPKFVDGTGGNGGDSMLGRGGLIVANSSSTGLGYGAGGSGGYCNSGSTTRDGAAGTNGLVIVTEYYV
jgi:hypothetical protein